MERYLQGTLIVPIKAQERDIRAFIKTKIDEDRVDNPEIMTQDLEEEIVKKITSLSNGV